MFKDYYLIWALAGTLRSKKLKKHSKDERLANIISSLQTNTEKKDNTSTGCGSKIGKGCMWAIIIVILMMLQMCIGAIMKQKGRSDVRYRNTYVIPQKPAICHVYQLL